MGLTGGYFGSPGATKTSLAASLCDHPHGKKVLIIDAEGGSSVVANFGKDVEFVNLVRKADASNVDPWEYLIDFYVELLEQDHEYKTVILDNVSEMNRLCIKYCQKTSEDKSEKDPDAPTMRVFLKANNKMNDMIRAFRNLAGAKNVNVVFLSWIDREKDDLTGRITHEVDLGKSLQKRVPGMVDVVGLLYKNDQGIPILQLDSDMSHPAVKFRRRKSVSWSIS